MLVCLFGDCGVLLSRVGDIRLLRDALARVLPLLGDDLAGVPLVLGDALAGVPLVLRDAIAGVPLLLGDALAGVPLMRRTLRPRSGDADSPTRSKSGDTDYNLNNRYTGLGSIQKQYFGRLTVSSFEL